MNLPDRPKSKVWTGRKAPLERRHPLDLDRITLAHDSPATAPAVVLGLSSDMPPCPESPEPSDALLECGDPSGSARRLAEREGTRSCPTAHPPRRRTVRWSDPPAGTTRI